MMNKLSLVILMLWMPLAVWANRVTLDIEAVVPEGTPPVSIAGNLGLWGPWIPGRVWMQGEGTLRKTSVRVDAGTAVEFKLTLGSWARQAVDTRGLPMGNHQLVVNEDMAVRINVVGFGKTPEEMFETISTTGLKGRAELIAAVPSTHLELPRSVIVWLPEQYDQNPDARFPVLYMHDGQNLFDPRVPPTGIDWGVDETITRLAAAGRIESLIVVGVFNTDHRDTEYRPTVDGEKYGLFLTEELKPMIDARFRTRTNPANTGVMGSSRGGVISFFLAMRHPDVFGRVGCVSTYYGEDLPWLESLESGPRILPVGRLYFDYGTAEPAEDQYPELQARATALLRGWRWTEGRDFVVHEIEGADHSEQAWRARLEQPLLFLFGTE